MKFFFVGLCTIAFALLVLFGLYCSYAWILFGKQVVTAYDPFGFWMLYYLWTCGTGMVVFLSRIP